MIKEAWEALRAAILLDSELKRQREDILRALRIIRQLAAENDQLRANLARMEKANAAMQKELRQALLNRMEDSPSPSDDDPQPDSPQIH